MIFNVGDMVKDKKAVSLNNIIHYAIITHVISNPTYGYIVKAQWITSNMEPITLSEREAQLWWIKVD